MPVPDFWDEVARRQEALSVAPTDAVRPSKTERRRTIVEGVKTGPGRGVNRGLVIGAAVAGSVLVVGAAVGSGLLRLSTPPPSVASPPILASSPSPVEPTPTPTPTPTATPTRPTPTAVATPAAPGPGSWTFGERQDAAPLTFSGATITLLQDGTILGAGGEARDFTTVTPAAEIYDLTTGRWTATGPMHDARRGHVAVRLADGRVLVAGGWNLATHDLFASAEIYDPATGSWTRTGSMRRWRQLPRAVLLTDGRVLVVGGGISGGGHTKGAEIYDPQTGSWESTANMLAPETSIATLADGTVLVTHSRGVPAERFDPATERWMSLAGTSPIGDNESATVLRDGRVLFLGAEADSFDSAHLYDPVAETWTATAVPSTGPGPAVTLNDGTVLVVGERGAARYNPGTGRWTAAAAPREHSNIGDSPLIQLADGRVFATEDGYVALFDPAGAS